MALVSKWSVLLFLGAVTLQGCGDPDIEGPTAPPPDNGLVSGSDDHQIREAGAACPYNFQKPKCTDAEPQAPRDLTDGAEGQKKPKAATLTLKQTEMLPLVNVHWHLGAEHKSEAYNDDTDSKAYDAGRRLRSVKPFYGRESSMILGEGRSLAESGEVRPGFMCPTADLTEEEKAPYEFKYCKGLEVGKTYEVHYVHSSAGYNPDDTTMADEDLLADGLGGAANGRGLLNPMVTVEGQVFLLVNGDDAPTDTLMNSVNAPFVKNGEFDDAVMYHGSTTGPSHDNEVCSPYAITWHQDKRCNKISAESFDNMCKVMKETYNMEADLYSHGSRKILDPKWVVPAEYVVPLA